MYNFAMYTEKAKFSVIGPGLKLSKILVNKKEAPILH